MAFGKSHRWRTAAASRANRPLVFIILFFLLATMVDLGEPVDNSLGMLRDRVRTDQISGKITVVFPDAATSNGHSEWSWSRQNISDLVKQLNRAGAARIVIGTIVSDPANGDDLAQTLSSLPQKPILAMGFQSDPDTGKKVQYLPARDLVPTGELALANQYFDPFGRVEKMPYRLTVNGKQYPGMASAIAGVDGPPDELFSIDYGMSSTELPEVSMPQLFSGGANLTGKTVIVASKNILMNLSGHERSPTAYANLFGAETLARGRPADYGTWPAYFLALIASIGIWASRKRTALLLSGVSVAALLALPIRLEQNLIFVGTAVAVLMVVTTTFFRLLRDYRSSASRQNMLTGIPNLAAFKEQKISQGFAVVACKAVNYPKLITVMPSHEADLVKQIVARLELNANQQLYHGDDGVFAWTVEPTMLAQLTDQLDALTLLFIKPFNIADWKVDVNVVFGIEVSDDPNMPARLAKAIMAADAAAARTKQWHYFDENDLNAVQSSLSMISDLETAIQNGELWVALQPKFRVHDLSLRGFEALARWSHPVRGMIPPDEFIPVAEAHGRIDNLTYFVMHEAVRALARLGKSDVSIAVNLSARMLEEADLTRNILAILQTYKIAPTRLILEITETAQLTEESWLFRSIHELQAVGIELSIDDYGTGYSTLEYIRKIRASELKLDKSFVSTMDSDPRDRLIVKATIDLAKSLNLRIVAEGVETEAHLAILAELGCDLAQGYHLGRPIPAEQITTYLETSERHSAA